MTQEKNLKKTPLYAYYKEKGLRLTDFGGWALPIQISKIAEEHQAVREGVGLFDVAHMGEVRITGEGAQEFINAIITNDVRSLGEKQAMYTAITNEEGGTLDDLIFYKISPNDFLFTPNASNTEKIYNWFVEHKNDEAVKVEDVSSDYGLIAIQGPKAQAVLKKVTAAPLTELSPFSFLSEQVVAGVENIVISQTGYTGEMGYELYLPFDKQLLIWQELLEAGEEFGIKECGLGARDTLRLEAGLALYGNDLTEDINPIEGGIGFTVKTGAQKEADYPGKEALEAFRCKDHKCQSRGFELTDRGIARKGMPVKLKDGTKIGTVTSGTKSPTFGKSLGFLLIDSVHGNFGEEVFIEIRNKLTPAKIVKKDWLRR